MIDPYRFVRGVTMGLGATWTVMGLVRAVRFTRRAKVRLALLELDDPWWRRHVTLAVLRATLLDSVNLALLCLLLGVWSLRLVE